MGLIGRLCGALAVAVLAVSLAGCAPTVIDASEEPAAEQEFVVIAEGLSSDPLAAEQNSAYLQNVIDVLSAGGGGTVAIPEGVYRFAASGRHSLGDFAIEMRSHVKIKGAGRDETVLMPVGIWAQDGRFEHGIDMFAYTGMRTGEYLVDADFEDFTIDGSEAMGSPEGYNASGKGFFFKLFRDCDWRNVKVCYTDGTGFGMDFPINCTMENCVAIGCGKNAGPDDAGASGVGIGTGYSGLESMRIQSCESYDNAKYGFFFEHQTRFNSRVEALSAAGYFVSECVASGNLYNFGGARAHDVVYERCVSKVSDDAAREVYTVRAFCFENHSYRTEVIDCEVEQRYDDVTAGDACFEATEWALDEGILESSATDGGEMLFRPHDVMLRSEAASLLWRYAGRPGDVMFDGIPLIASELADVAEADYYVDAALWMHELGDASLEEFRGQDPVLRAELVTMIWRMAGKPEVSRLTGFADVDEDAYYARALSWAVEQGFIEGSPLYFGPFETLTRAEVLMILRQYDEALATGLVGKLPEQVDEETLLDMHEQLGSTVRPRAAYAGFLDDEEIE